MISIEEDMKCVISKGGGSFNKAPRNFNLTQAKKTA